MMVFQLSQLAILLIVASPVWGAMQCGGSAIQVISSDLAVAKRVCTVVERVTPLLERCDLRQSRPLVFRIADDPTDTRPMGHYGIKENEINILAPSELAEILDDSSAYRRIAPENFFDSIVVHELTHAFFLNTRCGRETCLAGHEYIAYAMQFQTLTKQDRDVLTDALPASLTVELSWFTDDQLNETPELFAANAWRHFSQSGFGCDFVGSIVSGETVFSSDNE